jgi:nucleoside-diphosphate-sugar epimerase
MQARRKIAVAGATGRVGRHVVDVLEAEGHDVVAMAHSRGVDIVTGDGLADALEGVESIIDVATGPSPEEEPATAVSPPPPGTCTRPASGPACGGSWSRPSSGPTG